MLKSRRKRKDDFATKYIIVAAIFEDSVNRVIAIDKINKMADSGSPRFGVIEISFFCWISLTTVAL